MLCVGLIAGAVNDRFHRPLVLRLYALWYTLLSFGFTSLLYLGDVGVGHMLGYMFLVGVGFTFGPTARRAIYADSVTRSRASWTPSRSTERRSSSAISSCPRSSG